jgi:hypothetical protein
LTKLSNEKQLKQDELQILADRIRSRTKRIFHAVEDVGARCNAKAGLLRDMAESLDVNDILPAKNRKQREAEGYPWNVTEYEALADSVRPRRKKS